MVSCPKDNYIFLLFHPRIFTVAVGFFFLIPVYTICTKFENSKIK